MTKSWLRALLASFGGLLSVALLVALVLATPTSSAVAASAQREVLNAVPISGTMLFSDTFAVETATGCLDNWNNWTVVPSGTCRVEHLTPSYFGGYCSEINNPRSCVDAYGAAGGAPGVMSGKPITVAPGNFYRLDLLVGGNQRANRVNTVTVQIFADGTMFDSFNLSRDSNNKGSWTSHEFPVPAGSSGVISVSLKDVTLPNQDGFGAIYNAVYLYQGPAMTPDSLTIDPINVIMPRCSSPQRRTWAGTRLRGQLSGALAIAGPSIRQVAL